MSFPDERNGAGRRPRRRRRPNPALSSPVPRRGTIAALTGIMLVSLCGMVAFAVDLGYIVHVRTELQRTADACALAAVKEMPDLDLAVIVAQETAVANYGTSSPDLDPADVVFGYWNSETAEFMVPPPAYYKPNAVQVTLRRTQATGNPVSLFFAYLLATPDSDVEASAIAKYDYSICGPFVGIEWLQVPGNPQTDSYKSSQGYDPSYPRDRGSICSDGPITISGNPVIRGDARSGKNYDVILEGGPVITGAIGRRLKPLNMPPVDASEAAVYNDNSQLPPIPKGNSWVSPLDGSNNFVLDGNTVYDMPPGTYYFNNMTLSGQAVLNIYGPTKIYVTGDLYRAGGVQVNNNTKIPSNLYVLMTGGSAEITSSNNFHGVIYAPNTDVIYNGDAATFGAVVGKTLTVTGGGKGHYDELLNLETIDVPRRTTLVD